MQRDVILFTCVRLPVLRPASALLHEFVHAPFLSSDGQTGSYRRMRFGVRLIGC